MAAGDAAMMQLAQTFANLAQNTKIAGDALAQLSDKISNFLSISKSFNNLVESVKQLGTALSPLKTAFTKLLTTIRDTKAFKSLVDAVSYAASVIQNRLSVVFAPISSFFRTWLSAMDSTAGKLIRNFLAVSGASLKVAAALTSFIVALGAKIAGVLAKITGGGVGGALMGLVAGPAVAAGSLVGAFGSLADMAAGFVSALNPGIVEQLNLAFDDLTAVFGRLFVPILAAAVPIVRTFADSMVPLVNALIPSFQILANALISVAVPVIGAFAGVMLAMQPAFDKFAKLIGDAAAMFGEALIPIIDAMVPYWQALADIILSLMPPMMDLGKALMDMAVPIINLITPILIPALKMLASVIIWIVNKFSWVVGKITEAVTSIAPAKAGPNLKIPEVIPGASRGMAAKGAQFTGFAEFGAQLMQASFGSSVNTPEFKTAENTAKIAEGIDKLVAQNEKPVNQFAINQLGRGVR